MLTIGDGQKDAELFQCHELISFIDQNDKYNMIVLWISLWQAGFNRKEQEMSHPQPASIALKPTLPTVWTVLRAIAPGLGLTLLLAALATLVRQLSGIATLSPLMLAMVGGILVRNMVGLSTSTKPGITFSLKRILRFAIVLLGFQLTWAQLAEVGAAGFVAVAATLVATFVVIRLVGRMLGVGPALADLIAAGTSVCGASAVVACNTVTRGSDEDVAYAIAVVTIFGSISLLLFPVLGPALGLTGSDYGLWVGASVHEVAQVTGAAFQGGTDAGQAGTVAKLARVLMLAPLVSVLGAMARQGAGSAKSSAPMPWFVLGFVAVMAINSVWPLAVEIKQTVVGTTTFLLTLALAAMGLETDVLKLRARGLRPLVLGAFGWLFISVFAILALSFA